MSSALANDIRAGATVDDLRVAASETRAAELARHAYEGHAALTTLATDLRAFRNGPTIQPEAYTALDYLIDLAETLAERYAGVARLDATGTPELRDTTFDPQRELLAALHDAMGAL